MLSYLASLPGVTASANALSSALQRRVTLYLLKRVLGHFVQDGDLKVDQIEAGLGSGHVEIHNVHLDTEAINRHIAQVPVHVVRGSIASIIIDVPWSNLRTGELSIQITGVNVTLALVSTSPFKSAHRGETMKESIYSAAEEMLEQDEEGRELELSIAEETSSITTAAAPAPAPPPPTSYVARFVNGLLARLKVSLRDTAFHLDIGEDPHSALRLCVEEIVVRPNATSSTDEQQTYDPRNRTLSLSGITVLLERTLASEAPGSEAHQEVDDNDDDDDDDAYMNASTANLRESAAASFFSSGASMYASAVSHGPGDMLKQGKYVDSKTTLWQCAKVEDPITLQFQADSLDARSDLRVKVDVGHIYAMLDSNILVHLLQLNEIVASLKGQNTGQQDEDSVMAPTQHRSHITFTAKSLHVLAMYESTKDVVAPGEKHSLDDSLEAFWKRPSKVRPPFGHLRLRLTLIDIHSITGAELTSFQASISDATLFEFLSCINSVSNDSEGANPIIILDPGLEKAQGREAGQDPSLLVWDWRAADLHSPTDRPKASPYRRLDASESGWKVKGGHKRSSSSISMPFAESSSAVIQLRYSSSAAGSISFSFAPIHVFADFSLVDRLMPMLKRIGQSSQGRPLPSSFSDMTASIETLMAPSSISSLEASTSHTQVLISIRCPLIRVELRVPSDHSAQGRMRGGGLRSGIVVAEVSRLSATIGKNAQLEQSVSPLQERGLSFESVDLFFCPVKASIAQFVAALSHLPADDGETPCLPRIGFRTYDAAATHVEKVTSAQSTYDCRLPLIRATLTKPLLDGLELVVDDFSLWLSALRSDDDTGETASTPDALKILGSRFFGSRYSLLSSSSTSTEIVRRPERTPLLIVIIDEVSLALVIPSRRKAHFADQSKRLELAMSDIRLDVNSQEDLHFTKACLSIATLDLSHEGGDGKRHLLISRTLLPSLANGSQPVIRVDFTSTRDPYSSFRSSRIEIEVQNVTMTYDGDASLVQDLIIFSRSPEGAFEHVQPSEQTNVSVKLRDISLLLAPINASACIVLVLGSASMRAAIVSHHPKTTFRLRIAGSQLYASEKLVVPPDNKKARCRRPEEFWRSQGMWQLVAMQEIHILLLLSQFTRPEVEIRFTRVTVEVTACADSLDCVGEVAMAMQKPRGSFSTDGQVQSRTTEAQSSLLGSLDENAFKADNAALQDADLLEDDIPTHPGFWGTSKKDTPKSNIADAAGEKDIIFGLTSLSLKPTSELPQESQSDIILETDVVTVRLADPARPINPKMGYFADPNLALDSQESSLAYASSIRFIVRQCNITVRLFGGYDNTSTQTKLQEEARRVRRRLQQIKQMLDKGQQPDDSVEEASASLMDSVYIPTPVGVQLDATGMMQLMDDELGEQSETSSSVSTWKQFVSTPSSSKKRAPTPPRAKRSKLARSKNSMIDFELRGLKLDYDKYVAGSPIAARTFATIKNVRILDNIKTSSWHSFLTGIATDHTPLPQYSRDMVKIELRHLDEEEVRVKAKLTPLRLHVDQDALDFLKKFFSFELPRKGTEEKDASAPLRPRTKAKPFIQHAEIYPIRLKLDYKPKRVDYRQLRAGKTIEMMNFFNFEGSDITLRHVTLRGISGWPTLFEQLNDLWTPDVKSNQLADVLSGIAPIRSLVNVGNGVADLILLPIEQYQRDGRLGKGLRDGATRFVKSTVLEAARLGARLATGTQVILEQAENLLGGNGMTESVVIEDRSHTGIRRPHRHDEDTKSMDGRDSIDSSDDREYEEDDGVRARYSRYANQPADMRQALEDAQHGLSRGFNRAAQTILAVPMEVYDRQSGEGAGMPVVRAVPIAVLKGAAGASEAITKALQGVQRELGGIDLAEREEKYKQRPSARDKRFSRSGVGSSSSSSRL